MFTSAQSPASAAASQILPQPGQNFPSIKINHAFLVGLTGMNVYSSCSACEEISEALHMDLRIGAHRPTFVYFFQRNLSFRAPLNLLRIANIEIWLPCL